MRVHLIESFYEPIPELLVQFIHARKCLMDVASGEEPCYCHILQGTGTIETGMLEHRVLLEFLWVAAIKEAKHVLNGDSAVKDAAAYEDVDCGVKAQLAVLPVEERLHVIV